ncbi:hypothetical protein ABZ135_23625 [Streptomyces sp. NPDC006339]|uniref:hypothetical protein n=1 Tax=Streptomyces sp. NPDC006339 TaxID=3156755 RepID=UPI0033B674AB
MPAADDLHRRYMAANTAYRRHAAACAACTTTVPSQDCRAGKRLYEAFFTLQEAYLNHLK